MADWLVGKIELGAPIWPGWPHVPCPWRPEQLTAATPPADIVKNIKAISLDEAMALAEAAMSDPLGQEKRA